LITVPAFSAPSDSTSVKAVSPEICPDDDLQAHEIELLLAHAKYGCISLICSSANRRHPFVFVEARKYGLVRFAYLVYCRNLDEFVRFARPLGRFLAWRGCLLVVLDANGPINGLFGRYSDKQPKYFKGPDQPRLGDMAYSERPMFGV
jgi:hypothetical protein